MSLSARDYHYLTAYRRHRMSGHNLDWPAQPDVFKKYPNADPQPLPSVTAWPDDRASEIFESTSEPEPTTEINIGLTATVLNLSHALTAKAKHGGMDFYYRSSASAGALYPFELYVGASNVRGLPNGIYHHSVASQALTQFRSGDITDYLTQGLNIGEKPSPILSFFLTAIFFRSSWKYRERAYRYVLLDTGHLTENLCAGLAMLRVPFRLHYDFDDQIINDLLCLDTSREVCLAAAIGWGKPANDMCSRLPGSTLENPESASRVSHREVDYPLIHRIHEASSRVVRSDPSVGDMFEGLGLEVSSGIEIPIPKKWPEADGYVDAVFKRRSMRNFVHKELPSDCFRALVHMVCSSASSYDRPLDQTLAVGLVAGNIEGIEPGFYLLDRKRRSLLPAAHGFMMDKMASVCLNQEWLGNCAIHFLFLINLEFAERLCGARAYRYAMLSAGRLGQRIYVGATAMRLGCCGIGAFYDDEAACLLGLPDQSRLLYLVAVGPVKNGPTPIRI
jgi:SagB-type dehydrogenase family enzyme